VAEFLAGMGVGDVNLHGGEVDALDAVPESDGGVV
jgi:hypothetical protein